MRPSEKPFDVRRPREASDAAEVRRRGATRIAPRPEPTGGDGETGDADAPPVARRPVRVARGINALLVAVCLVGSLHAVGLTVVEVRRLAYSEREIARLEAEIDGIDREAADLRAVAERADDERYRELLARRQGYVFPDETRFIGPQPR